jgi:peroxiredoxin
VREAYPALTALGARAIAVGTGADFQARRLMAEGMPFPCLVDPERNVYRALGLGRVSWRTVFMPATYVNYARGWLRGVRQGKITGDPRQLSGVAVLDADSRPAWVHRSRTIGDYPSVADVVAQVERLAA